MGDEKKMQWNCSLQKFVPLLTALLRHLISLSRTYSPSNRDPDFRVFRTRPSLASAGRLTAFLLQFLNRIHVAGDFAGGASGRKSGVAESASG